MRSQIVTSDSVCWNLRLVSRITKGTSSGPLDQAEVLAEQALQSIQRAEVLAVFLVAADPFLAPGVLFQPGVRGGDQQDAARIQALVHRGQKFRRAVQAVDQVGGKNQVIAREQGLEVAGVTLEKFHFLPRFIQAEIGKRAFPVRDQFALVGQGIAQHALLGELDAQPDEAGRKIDARDLIEMARQFETGAPGSAAQVQRLVGRFFAHRPDGELCQCTGKIGHAEILIPVVEFGIFGKQLVGFVAG